MNYGSETAHALENFSVNHQTVPESLIKAMILVKKNASKALKYTK